MLNTGLSQERNPRRKVTSYELQSQICICYRPFLPARGSTSLQISTVIFSVTGFILPIFSKNIHLFRSTKIQGSKLLLPGQVEALPSSIVLSPWLFQEYLYVQISLRSCSVCKKCSPAQLQVGKLSGKQKYILWLGQVMTYSIT